MHKRTSLLLIIAISSAMAVTLWGATLKFYDDDPILVEPETRDASGVKEWTIDLFWDLTYNLFARPGDPESNVRAENINTIDEVPDSNWFTNRILSRPVSVEEAAKGPITGNGPAPPPWTLISPKAAGQAPGFTMRDSQGAVWFVSFDAKDHSEAATSAIIVANKIFWTLGYWQVENYLISIGPEDVRIAETARMRLANGKRRPMRQSDLDDVFRRSERSADGRYRAVAGKGLSGTILGGFKYQGTRPDDPNDVVPHEHRRELRALKVFGAWTNLVDMKAGNTLDTLVQQGDKKIVRHYLQDVGSTFGAAALGPHDYDEGWEYLYEGSTLMKRLVSFGFYIRPWQTADYQEYQSIGRFEAKAFDPIQWKPRVPTAAFVRARPDDNFWAARRVMAFSDNMIRAIVNTGRFSDPRAEKLLADTLIARRAKIGQVYLTGVNPLVTFVLDNSGALTFVNAAVAAGVAAAPTGGYTANWATFDNPTGQTQPLGASTTAQSERMQAPTGLPAQNGSFVKVQVAAVGSPNTSWGVPVSVYFKRTPAGWKLVGLER
jgi:hypothetical protein